MRTTDTVARTGGDEFVVMLEELESDKSASIGQAGVIAEKIRAQLAQPYVLTVSREGDQPHTVLHHCSASIGVVVFLDNKSSKHELLKWADSTMYRAKQDGRNRVRFFGEDLG